MNEERMAVVPGTSLWKGRVKQQRQRDKVAFAGWSLSKFSPLCWQQLRELVCGLRHTSAHLVLPQASARGSLASHTSLLLCILFSLAEPCPSTPSTLACLPVKPLFMDYALKPSPFSPVMGVSPTHPLAITLCGTKGRCPALCLCDLWSVAGGLSPSIIACG